jgi:hypothetical protein
MRSEGVGLRASHLRLRSAGVAVGRDESEWVGSRGWLLQSQASAGLWCPLQAQQTIGAPLRAGRGCRFAAAETGTVVAMSAQPTSGQGPHQPYEVIHLGGEAAAIVPLSDLRRLRAVERRASAEVLEDAEIEATLAAHQEWVAAGRPGAVSHEEAMAELLGQ